MFSGNQYYVQKLLIELYFWTWNIPLSVFKHPNTFWGHCVKIHQQQHTMVHSTEGESTKRHTGERKRHRRAGKIQTTAHRTHRRPRCWLNPTPSPQPEPLSLFLSPVALPLSPRSSPVMRSTLHIRSSGGRRCLPASRVLLSRSRKPWLCEGAPGQSSHARPHSFPSPQPRMLCALTELCSGWERWEWWWGTPWWWCDVPAPEMCCWGFEPLGPLLPPPLVLLWWWMPWWWFPDPLPLPRWWWCWVGEDELEDVEGWASAWAWHASCSPFKTSSSRFSLLPLLVPSMPLSPVMV